MTAFAEILELVPSGGVEELRRCSRVSLERREEDRRLCRRDSAAPELLLELGLRRELSRCLEVPSRHADALAALAGEPASRRNRTIALVSPKRGCSASEQQASGTAEPLAAGDLAKQAWDVSRGVFVRLQASDEVLEILEDVPEAAAGVRIEHMFVV